MKTITMVDASDFPIEVMDYCLDHDISTHYQNDVAFIRNDNNPFAIWLRDSGYEFKSAAGDWIAIMAT